MSKNKDISILDVTIRDGSYLINYQYSPDQVASVASALDRANIDYIEVSHGCGLGAGKNLGISAAASDSEYVKAAKSAVKHAKIGVIAGAAPVTLPADIDTIIDDVDFIRFAANCDNPITVKANINYARRRRPDLTVLFQMMRSSRLPLSKLIESARMVEDLGAEAIYLVDTVGYFMPEEVSEIVSSLESELQIDIGFHGHNNLGMAIANSIAAAEAGAKYIDASLKGVGRAGGNAQLESLVSLLKRKGYAKNIDLDELIIAADRFIGPIIPPGYGIDSIDVLTANSNIDLYPLKSFEHIAQKSEISLLELIETLGEDRNVVEVDRSAISSALEGLGLEKKRVEDILTPTTKNQKPGKHRIANRANLNAGVQNAVLALKTNLPYMEFPDALMEWIVERHPNISFHFTTFDEKKIDKIEEADILFSYYITPDLLKKAKRLKWFHSVVTGPDTYTFPELIERDLIVTSPRGVYSVPIAESIMGMMLAHCRKLRESIQLQDKKSFDTVGILKSSPPPTELLGATAVIVGLGGVGTATAIHCRSLGMAVLAVVPDDRPKSEVVDEQVPFDRLHDALKIADYVILTCPLTKDTRDMIGIDEFKMMKPTSYLINVSRGELIDEKTLAEALKKKVIAGAAADVFRTEPLPKSSPLYNAPNMIITPHISGLSTQFWARAIARFDVNLEQFTNGDELIGEVDFTTGY
ncbi:MAG: hypothetical protein HN337_02770 [Deltaproteobacteria bacterium]|nr:hypothetical protein [Deltaproteobacteria bacterium]